MDKTAMQMLIEAMQRDYDSIDGSESRIANVQKSEVGLRISQVKSLLQKEQEQIEKAFESGYGEGVFRGNIIIDADDGVTPDKYYQSKYGGENVTNHLEDKHLKTILGKIEGIYFAQLKKLEEENMSYAVEYLNSFVGK